MRDPNGGEEGRKAGGLLTLHPGRHLLGSTPGRHLLGSTPGRPSCTSSPSGRFPMSSLWRCPSGLLRANCVVVPALVGLLLGCRGESSTPGPDSAAVAQAAADSLTAAQRIRAAELLVDARGVIASLLADSASATFEEMVVVQPPASNGTTPALVVCGKVNGKPGIGGRSTPTSFVYTSRWSVFVEEASNQTAFRALWDRTCGHPGSVVQGDG